MNILRRMLYALGLVLLIALAGIYFLPDSYSVKQSIEIDRPVETVYPMVSNYSNWKAWSPWAEMEPEATVTIAGEPGKPGHSMSWSGKKIGKGTLSIRMASSNGFVNGELNFEKPFKAIASDKWSFEAEGNKTIVTWISEGELRYPIGRLFGLTLGEALSKQEKHGLEKLKKVCESLPDAAALATKEDSLPVAP